MNTTAAEVRSSKEPERRGECPAVADRIGGWGPVRIPNRKGAMEKAWIRALYQKWLKKMPGALTLHLSPHWQGAIWGGRPWVPGIWTQDPRLGLQKNCSGPWSKSTHIGHNMGVVYPPPPLVGVVHITYPKIWYQTSNPL